MTINWNDKAVLERLYISTLASLPNNINVHEVARLYGGEMTYYALENRLRVWKKAAKELKEAGGNSNDTVNKTLAKSPGKAVVKSPVKKSTASSDKDAVKTGRVAKRKSSTRSKIQLQVLSDESADDDDDETYKEFV